MKLSAPKMITWVIALILGLVALAGVLGVAAVEPYAIWAALAGLALMLVATLVKGL